MSLLNAIELITVVLVIGVLFLLLVRLRAGARTLILLLVVAFLLLALMSLSRLTLSLLGASLLLAGIVIVLLLYVFRNSLSLISRRL